MILLDIWLILEKFAKKCQLSSGEPVYNFLLQWNKVQSCWGDGEDLWNSVGVLDFPSVILSEIKKPSRMNVLLKKVSDSVDVKPIFSRKKMGNKLLEHPIWCFSSSRNRTDLPFPFPLPGQRKLLSNLHCQHFISEKRGSEANSDLGLQCSSAPSYS